jgi:hypothetical protein
MGKGGRKGGTEDRTVERIDRSSPRESSGDRDFWDYLAEVSAWSGRHGFGYTETEVKQAWSSGKAVEDFILAKCRRR